eukprot:gene4914-6679_t
MNQAVITQAVIVKNRPLVEVRGVCQTYDKGSAGKLIVLDQVGLTLASGEIVGLLGRSGSGKSTLLRSIAGLIRPSEGAITFEGKHIVLTPADEYISSFVKEVNRGRIIHVDTIMAPIQGSGEGLRLAHGTVLEDA